MHGIGRFWCVFGVVAGLLALPFQAGADDAAARVGPARSCRK